MLEVITGGKYRDIVLKNKELIIGKKSFILGDKPIAEYCRGYYLYKHKGEDNLIWIINSKTKESAKIQFQEGSWVIIQDWAKLKIRT